MLLLPVAQHDSGNLVRGNLRCTNQPSAIRPLQNHAMNDCHSSLSPPTRQRHLSGQQACGDRRGNKLLKNPVTWFSYQSSSCTTMIFSGRIDNKVCSPARSTLNWSRQNLLFTDFDCAAPLGFYFNHFSHQLIILTNKLRDKSVTR